MLKRLFVFGLGTSMVQIIIFYSFILIVYWFAAAIEIGYPGNSDPNGDYIVLFSAIIFAIMVLIQNVVSAIINKKKVTYVLMTIAITTYMVGLIDIGSSVPFKSAICLIFGLVVLGIKTKIDDRMVR